MQPHGLPPKARTSAMQGIRLLRLHVRLTPACFFAGCMQVGSEGAWEQLQWAMLRHLESGRQSLPDPYVSMWHHASLLWQLRQAETAARVGGSAGSGAVAAGAAGVVEAAAACAVDAARLAELAAAAWEDRRSCEGNHMSVFQACLARAVRRLVEPLGLAVAEEHLLSCADGRLIMWVDVAVLGANVVVEADGPWHALRNHPARPTGASLARDRLLRRALGQEVVSLPYTVWDWLWEAGLRPGSIEDVLADFLVEQTGFMQAVRRGAGLA